MKIYITYFTEKGAALCESLEWEFQEDELFIRNDRPLSEWTAEAFDNADAIIFIGAVGIAVRACAPFLRGKAVDPAVVVCDELEKYAIPILSGHIGGANALALQIAKYLDAIPVITTATDLNGVWAVDNWAVQNGYYILNPWNIKYISSALLRGEKVGIISDIPIEGLPENVVLNDTECENVIVVSPFVKSVSFKNNLYIVPRCLVLGVGCKKDTPVSNMAHSFACLRIRPNAVKTIATIDIKRGEAAIHALAEQTGAELRFYTAEELNGAEGEFTASDFVKNITGTDNVCERAAVLASGGGELVIKKTAANGVTFAACMSRFPL